MTSRSIHLDLYLESNSKYKCVINNQQKCGRYIYLVTVMTSRSKSLDRYSESNNKYKCVINPFSPADQTDACGNVVDQDEMACNELSHQDLHFLPFCF